MAEPRFCDELEIRDPEARERDLLAALPAQIAHAKSRAPYYARTLAAIEPRAVKSRARSPSCP